MAVNGVQSVFGSWLRLGKRTGWLSLLLWVAAIAPAAALELRVAIEENVGQVAIGSSSKAVVKDASGKTVGEIAGLNAFVAQPKDGQVALDKWKSQFLWVEPSGGGYVWIGDRWYRGRTLVVPSSNGLTAVNYVDLEQYLFSVLGSEMGGNWPLEALKSQAVAARSYALYQREKSGNSVYDIGDTEAWQVYKGIETETGSTQAAVAQTAGQVLTYDNKIVEAVFHSSAGGCVDNAKDVWGTDVPYLRKTNDYDTSSPVAQWNQNFSNNELSQRISGVGNIRSITVTKRSACNRIVEAQIEGDGGTKTVDGDDLRLALGLRSTMFVITPQSVPKATPAVEGNKEDTTKTPKDAKEVKDAKPKPTPDTFQISGRGFGHGLGLSQYGALAMANSKANYLQILGNYYPGTKLARIEVR